MHMLGLDRQINTASLNNMRFYRCRIKPTASQQ
jgi:hypothetical protein